ncbi:MAG: hypothetical protein ABI910_03710 [Gemmatimonadota bacterium]
MRPLRAALLLTAACSAAVGVVFLLLPPAVGSSAARPIGADSTFTPPMLAPGDPELAEDVVLANVFSVRRAPPTSRYAPPDAAMDSSGGVVAEPADASEVVSTPSGDPMLLGTVVGARGTQALLQLDPSGGSPRLYAVGDRDGGYRVIAIAPRSVILAGPRGRVTVRLESEEKRP